MMFSFEVHCQFFGTLINRNIKYLSKLDSKFSIELVIVKCFSISSIIFLFNISLMRCLYFGYKR